MGTDQSILLLAVVLLPALLFFGGCVQSIDSQDKFSVDLNNAPVYNFSRYVNASLCEPVNRTVPCTCMVCTVEKPSFTAQVLNLLRWRDINVSLLSAQCKFQACNASMYNDTIARYLEDKTNSDCQINGVDKLCAPRFFMLGQGSTPADYAMAQRYCDGQLKMPVIWAVPNATTGRLDKAPVRPDTISCYLQKDQMPAIVWYSAGKFIDTPEYSAMVRNFSRPAATPKVDGPVMVTTEAMLDPYLPADATTGAPRRLDMAKLQQVANQVSTIRSQCPKCLSVLALKITMRPSGEADLCALDYFLNDNASMPRPDYCREAYGGGADPAWTTRTDLYRAVDIIGVGFDANADPNLTSCTSDAAIGPALGYSRAALARYYKPSVWYAVGISPGPTATRRCGNFTEEDVQNMYSTLVTNIPALVSSGVIGVSPYRFSDNPDGAPLPYGAESFAFNTTLGGLDIIRNVKKSGELTIDSTDGTNRVVVDRYLPERSDAAQAVFLGGDGIVYSARYSGSTVALWALSSQTGFARTNGQFHLAAAYTWFSSCEYYYTNRAPLFRVNKTMAEVVAGAKLESIDKRDHLTVEAVEQAGVNETLFWGRDSKPYSARPDGAFIKLYERPLAAQSTQQPVMFSTNGKSAMCSAFETTKMYSRAQVLSGATGKAYSLTSSQNMENKRRIAALSCTGGCLSSVRMPKAFCYRSGKSNFNSDYCTVYPQIEDAVSAQSFDPLFMRAIFQHESGGAFNRCAMSKDEGNPAACGGRKDCTDLGRAATLTSGLDDPIATNTCEPAGVESRCEIIQQTGAVCALGFAQCIDPPFSTSGAAGYCGGANYNPFNPYDSACCGTRKMIVATYGGDSRTGGYLAQVLAKTSADTDWRKFIRPGEEEWYAAWFAMRNYRGDGPTISDLDYALKSVPQSELDAAGGPVAWVDENKVSEDVKYYSTNTIVRYNDAIKKCDSGCPYRDCSATGGGEDEGDTGEVIAP